jgi:hypothetical protein
MSALGQKQTFRSAIVMFAPESRHQLASKSQRFLPKIAAKPPNDEAD